MSPPKGLVLDVNIVMRAVFGKRVLHLWEEDEDGARFYTPDVCFQDVPKCAPLVSKQRCLNADARLARLQQVGRIVKHVDR